MWLQVLGHGDRVFWWLPAHVVLHFVRCRHHFKTVQNRYCPVRPRRSAGSMYPEDSSVCVVCAQVSTVLYVLPYSAETATQCFDCVVQKTVKGFNVERNRQTLTKIPCNNPAIATIQNKHPQCNNRSPRCYQLAFVHQLGSAMLTSGGKDNGARSRQLQRSEWMKP